MIESESNPVDHAQVSRSVGSLVRIAKDPAEGLSAIFDLGNLLWLQAGQVSLLQPAISHEDREYSE